MRGNSLSLSVQGQSGFANDTLTRVLIKVWSCRGSPVDNFRLVKLVESSFKHCSRIRKLIYWFETLTHILNLIW